MLIVDSGLLHQHNAGTWRLQKSQQAKLHIRAEVSLSASPAQRLPSGEKFCYVRPTPSYSGYKVRGSTHKSELKSKQRI